MSKRTEEEKRSRKYYPSDNARRKPFIKIHLTWRGHPRYGHAVEDPFMRGVIHGILEVAGINYASRTSDIVTLYRHDLTWVTGRQGFKAQYAVVKDACKEMSWLFSTDRDLLVKLIQADGESDANSEQGQGEFDSNSGQPQGDLKPRLQQGQREVIHIHIRNWSKKQGFAPHEVTGYDGEACGVRNPRTTDLQNTELQRQNTDGEPPAAAPGPALKLVEDKEEKPPKTTLRQWYDEKLVPAFPEHRRVQLKTGWTEVQKLNPSIEKRERILEGLEAWKASFDWQKEDGRFAQGVAKFISDRTWERKPPPSEAGQMTSVRPVRRGEWGHLELPNFVPIGGGSS